jgi:hypothetical protein
MRVLFDNGTTRAENTDRRVVSCPFWLCENPRRLAGAILAPLPQEIAARIDVGNRWDGLGLLLWTAAGFQQTDHTKHDRVDTPPVHNRPFSITGPPLGLVE